MARIRSKRPEFYTSGSVARCSIHARYLFEGLWTFMDDSGVHPADALQAKMEIFPADDFSEKQINGWIQELLAQDCLAEFEIPANDDPALKHFVGRKFWMCVSWHHQKIDHPTPVRAPIRALWRNSRGEVDPAMNDFGAAARQAQQAPSTPAAPATNDAIGWDAVRQRANAEFSGLGLEKKKQDFSLVMKICYLAVAGRIRDEWVAEASKALKKAKDKSSTGSIGKPGALLTQIFKNKCSEAKPPLDFRRLLAECPEPPSKEAPSAAPPSPPPAAAPVAVDVAALAGAAVKGPPPPDKKPAQSGAEIARQLRQLEAEDRRLAQQKNGQQKKSA
jgi:hypothetical protein